MLLVAAALAAAQPAPPVQTAIRRHFDAALFDGPSARWRWPEQRNSTLYCGWVNAKNRLGAYTGWTPYFVILEGRNVTEGRVMADNRVINQIFGERCQASGYDVLSPPGD